MNGQPTNPEALQGQELSPETRAALTTAFDAHLEANGAEDGEYIISQIPLELGHPVALDAGQPVLSVTKPNDESATKNQWKYSVLISNGGMSLPAVVLFKEPGSPAEVWIRDQPLVTSSTDASTGRFHVTRNIGIPESMPQSPSRTRSLLEDEGKKLLRAIEEGKSVQ